MNGSQHDQTCSQATADSSPHDRQVAQALAAGGPQRVGWFRYSFDDDHWQWSPQVERMHGYLPGAAVPTTETVLAHKHPEDYRQVADTLELIRQTRQAFSSRHRIVDVAGRVHHVVVVGDQLRDDANNVIGTHGFYIDVTPAEKARQDQITAAVSRITERRASIEQVKGMLMVIYEIDEDAAFELLKWRSQETQVKLRSLAEQISSDFTGLRHNGTMPSRSTYDNLLMTAHLRCGTPPEDALSDVV
ncbi:MAG TPA: PAS and ANTAR domain-containing protein [Mycobacterium sp.]|jgi:PAS domain S-box-containing protein